MRLRVNLTMKKLLSIFLISTSFLSSTVQAGTMTANRLDELCKSTNIILSHGCAVYVDGFIDGLNYGDLYQISSSQGNTTVLTVINIFLKEMRENPQNGDKEASEILANSLFKVKKIELR